MLAERAGVTLEGSAKGPNSRGPSRTELLAVTEWAERTFAGALADSAEARAYVEARGISGESVVRFRLGFAPESRDWLLARARKEGHSIEVLERVGLGSRPADRPGRVHERFRGRLMFPIHDLGGRVLGFGGRVLPSVERAFAEAGKGIAKYLNSPETVLFQKRKILYAADLARAAARESGWVAVVEGYTDVIAAHQAGLQNVVGTLGTALGEDHVQALRRLADRVVLVFDGDAAGQSAADRALELFLGHEIDVRVLSLPGGLDPCDFLTREGADAFRDLVGRAVDPLSFAIARAEARFDLTSLEDSRLAAEWVLSILGRVPRSHAAGLDVKVAKALDTLSQRLRVPVATLDRRLKELQRAARRSEQKGRRAPAPGGEDGAGAQGGPGETAPAVPMTPIRPEELDPIDRELVQIALNEPLAVARLVSRVAVASVRDAPLRAILAACYDLHGEGESTTFERVSLRLEDARVRSLAAGLLLPTTATRGDRHPIDPQPVSEGVRPASWEVRLANTLAMFDERDWRDRLRDLKAALEEINESTHPEEHRALRLELYRLHSKRPDTKTKNAS